MTVLPNTPLESLVTLHFIVGNTARSLLHQAIELLCSGRFTCEHLMENSENYKMYQLDTELTPHK